MAVSKALIRVLVVLFLVLDGALGVLAWRHVSGDAATSAPVFDGADNPDVFVPDGAGQGEGASGDVSAQNPATATMIDANAQGVVIVATAGTCDGAAPTVLVSEDGGTNFAPVKPPVSRVLAVNARTDGGLDLVGADDSCEAIGLNSRDGGATWTDSSVGTGWYRDPTSATGVVVGTTSVDTGCEVIAVSGLNPRAARVSCADGTALSTDDAGQTWEAIDGLSSVRALSFSTPARGVALVQTNDCSATAFVTTDGDTWDQRGCIDGQVGRAVVEVGGRLLASVDAVVSESADGGLTWNQPVAEVEPSAEPSDAASPADGDADGSEDADGDQS